MSHDRYRGGNVLALMASALLSEYPSGQWATYKQWAGIGAQVRKGERGTGCLFWTLKQEHTTVEDEETGEDVQLSTLPRLRARAFVVFNAAQVDGYTPPPAVLNIQPQIAQDGRNMPDDESRPPTGSVTACRSSSDAMGKETADRLLR